MTSEAFFRIVERLRLALLTTVDLTDRERRLALLMVERIHRRSYEDAGTLVSWLSVPTIAALTGIDERSIKRLRQSLRAKSVVSIEQEGGRGPRSTAVYAFDRRWIERNAPVIGANGGWTTGRPEPEPDLEASLPAPCPAAEWVASTATLRTDMSGHGAHPRMALETPLKGGLGDHPTPLNTKPMTEPLEARASASAREGRDFGASVRAEPTVDPASLADAEFATWLSSARAGMSVPLARLAKSSDIGEATLVAIESRQVIATLIVRSRIIRGLKHLAPESARLQVADGEPRTERAASQVGIIASSHRSSTVASRWGAHIAAYKVEGTDARPLPRQKRGIRDAATGSGSATSAQGWRPGPPTSAASKDVADQGVPSVFEQFREAWQLEHGGGRKAEAVWLAWFSRAQCEGIEDGRLQIGVLSRAARDYLWSNYDDLTERAARRLGLSGADIVVRARC
ncbi:hypothetical protein E9232_003368 [Inquilinus ginsengisoli]|uniref:DnaA N-terminal domain-containing protein n=1 Tax=Inquilinus ginsengisoli TaxID=363840 RepID=A0ABU1JQE0_9PROT|nr:hypothetical protein [Inquilinus ginsengisoli]MDR6290842.1 hypothetical protein [Inquilinus ginsengisoli]